MSGHYPPLTYRDVRTILRNLGFAPRPRTGTSHEQWCKTVDNHLYKVTVDGTKAPFSQILIRSMAAQAGVSKRDFYAALRL